MNKDGYSTLGNFMDVLKERVDKDKISKLIKKNEGDDVDENGVRDLDQ